MLPVSEAHCKYLTPAKYDELLVIESTLDPNIKGGMKIDYRILSEDLQTVHATGTTLHAFVNGEGRVTRPPQFIRDLIHSRTAPKP